VKRTALKDIICCSLLAAVFIGDLASPARATTTVIQEQLDASQQAARTLEYSQEFYPEATGYATTIGLPFEGNGSDGVNCSVTLYEETATGDVLLDTATLPLCSNNNAPPFNLFQFPRTPLLQIGTKYKWVYNMGTPNNPRFPDNSTVVFGSLNPLDGGGACSGNLPSCAFVLEEDSTLLNPIFIDTAGTGTVLSQDQPSHIDVDIRSTQASVNISVFAGDPSVQDLLSQGTLWARAAHVPNPSQSDVFDHFTVSLSPSTVFPNRFYAAEAELTDDAGNVLATSAVQDFFITAMTPPADPTQTVTLQAITSADVQKSRQTEYSQEFYTEATGYATTIGLPFEGNGADGANCSVTLYEETATGDVLLDTATLAHCSNNDTAPFNLFQFPRPPLLYTGIKYKWVYNTGTPIFLFSSDNSTVVFASGLNGGGTCSGGASMCSFVLYQDPMFIPKVPLTVTPGLGNSNIIPQAKYAEPVSTGNGNYYYRHIDLTIPGRGLPFVFARSYNALDNYAGPLGAKWTHSYNILLLQNGTDVLIKWDDGHGETYSFNGTTYVPQPGVFNSLIANTDGSFLLTKKNQTKYSFTSTGRLSSITDRNGNSLLLKYDSNGNLTQITDTVGRAILLTYDASNRITTLTDPASRTVSFGYSANNDLAQTTDQSGGVTAFAYDSSHHVTSITLPNGNILLKNIYDTQSRTISQMNGRNFTTTFAYDTPGPGQTTITDPLGNHTVHSYDALMRIINITDALGGMVTYTYDSNNDRTSTTNQRGKTTNFSYDVMGNITEVVDALGNASVFTYDSISDLLSATNPKGKITTFSYDGSGNLSSLMDALGGTTKFTHDVFGELTVRKDARGNTTGFAYDSMGNLVTLTDPLAHATHFTYDQLGRLTGLADANNHTITAVYDSLNRLISVSDALLHTTRFGYDTVSNLSSLTDANGQATQYAYDAVSNLVSVTDALNHNSQYTYDANNNRLSFINAKGNITHYSYDALARLILSTDPLGLQTAYGYDPAGDLSSLLDAKHQTTTTSYDADNRITGISYADGKAVAYAYDADSDRTLMTDSVGHTTYAYDSLDRISSVIDPNGRKVTYGYDAIGNRQSLGYPDGKQVSYAYDAANRLSSAMDWLHKSTAYAYDPVNNLTAVVYPNGASLGFGYDSANRLILVRNIYSGSSNPNNPISRFSYSLDAVGNRVQVADGTNNTTTYAYDALNELLSARQGSATENFTYDPAGNRLSLKASALNVAYSYDADDRLLQGSTGSPATTILYQYDADGNVIQRQLANNAIINSLRYDAGNRLVGSAVRNLAAATTSFTYDGDGNRVGQNSYSYVNDIAAPLSRVLQEQGPDGQISYEYGLGLIQETGSTFQYFYHHDGLSSVVGLTDPTANLRAEYGYEAWGVPIFSLDPGIGTRNKFRFAGEGFDMDTGLYYLRARYYDPLVGRFLTPDPFAGVPAVTRSSNRYLYAFGNPTRYTDPSGLFSLDIVDAFSNAFAFVTDAFRQPALNEQVSTCFNDIGNEANCTGIQQKLLQQQKGFQNVAAAGAQTTVSAVGVVYDPGLSGIPEPLLLELIDQGISLFGHLNIIEKAFGGIPVVNAPAIEVPAASSSTSPPPGIQTNTEGSSQNEYSK
jgi:RHS repeat-associated protein